MANEITELNDGSDENGSGGLIMVDNAFAFGQLLDPKATDREVPAVRAFNDHMAKGIYAEYVNYRPVSFGELTH